jgi:RHS repeat-associated protein
VVTDANGEVTERHDYRPFGEELFAGVSGRTSDLKYPGGDTGVRLKFTGKERDAETGLDYFGARYFSGAQGRFTSPDPKQITARHLSYPQKWNKYVYVQNNPLAAIDPDGLDDYKVFIAAPEAKSGRWKQAERVAKANGHTLQVFSGDSGPRAASVENWNRALRDPNSRAIFVGHTTHDTINGQNVTNGIRLVNGISAGTASQTTDQANSATITSVTVNANTVGLFGCDTASLAGQYAADNTTTSFIGVDSGADKKTTLEALSAAAPAFVAAEAAARPANSAVPRNPPNPVAAANQALQQNKRNEDQNDERIVQRN